MAENHPLEALSKQLKKTEEKLILFDNLESQIRNLMIEEPDTKSTTGNPEGNSSHVHKKRKYLEQRPSPFDLGRSFEGEMQLSGEVKSCMVKLVVTEDDLSNGFAKGTLAVTHPESGKMSFDKWDAEIIDMESHTLRTKEFGVRPEEDVNNWKSLFSDIDRNFLEELEIHNLEDIKLPNSPYVLVRLHDLSGDKSLRDMDFFYYGCFRYGDKPGFYANYYRPSTRYRYQNMRCAAAAI